MKVWLPVAVFLSIALAGCATAQPVPPTSTPGPPTLQPTLSATSISSSITVTLVRTVTLTPSPVVTSAPTNTSTPEPTSTPVGPYVPEDFLAKIADPLRARMSNWGDVMHPVENSSKQFVYDKFEFVVYDLWGKDIPLTSTSGELIVTSKIAAIVCYPRTDGRIDWLVVPLVIETPTGQLIVLSTFKSPVKATSENVSLWTQELKYLKDKGGWERGSIQYVLTSSNPQQTYNNDTDGRLRDTKNVSRDIVLKLTVGRERTMKNFIDTGDSNNDMVLYPMLVNDTGSQGK